MSDLIISVTDDNFEAQVKGSDKPVLVDFWAPWCQPCLKLAPTLDEVAAEYGDKVTIAKMNVDENANIPAEMNVKSIPFLVLFKGGQVVTTKVGQASKAELMSLIDGAL